MTLAFSAAAASFFLFSFSAFLARPDSFLVLAPLGAMSVQYEQSRVSSVAGSWTLVGAMRVAP